MKYANKVEPKRRKLKVDSETSNMSGPCDGYFVPYDGDAIAALEADGVIIGLRRRLDETLGPDLAARVIRRVQEREPIYPNGTNSTLTNSSDDCTPEEYYDTLALGIADIADDIDIPARLRRLAPAAAHVAARALRRLHSYLNS